jgi:hypothetical protein
MTAFWKTWLTLSCLGAGIFGLVLYVAGFPAATGPTDQFLRLIGNPWPAEAGKHLHFAFGLMGAITIGWMITLYTLFRVAWTLDAAAARPLWRGAALAIAVWYVIDSYISIATGFPLNAVSNTVLAAAMLLPIWLTGNIRKAA